MKVSVVMTTYNGKRFLKDMLDSLRNQTRKIDELLIYDDKSTDGTPKIVQEYIEQHALENWRLFENKNNLGWEKNFFQGLSSATGDVLYPCDQDDIWHLEKIEKMTSAFERNSQILLLVSGYHAFNEYGGETITQQPVKTETVSLISKVVFDKHYYQILRPGCTMAFKKELLPIFLENWQSGMPHDAVLWILAALLDGLYLYNDTLIEFRRHDTNASRSISHGYIYKVNEAERTKLVNRWYRTSMYYNNEKADIINGCDSWCELRIQLLRGKNLLAWIKLFKYRDYYLTPKKYMGDIYYFFCQFRK